MCEQLRRHPLYFPCHTRQMRTLFSQAFVFAMTNHTVFVPSYLNSAKCFIACMYLLVMTVEEVMAQVKLCSALCEQRGGFCWAKHVILNSKAKDCREDKLNISIMRDRKPCYKQKAACRQITKETTTNVPD